MAQRRDDLVGAFDALALAGKESPPKPSYVTPTRSHDRYEHPTLNPPYSQGRHTATSLEPSMPIPMHQQPQLQQQQQDYRLPAPSFYPQHQQSLTMQHALSDPTLPLHRMVPPPNAPRQHSASPIPAQLEARLSPHSPRPRGPSDSSVPPAMPISPSRSSKSGDTVQCSGFTKAEKQCIRQVKPSAAIVPGVPAERFCHQHSKEVLEPTGFYARKTGVWIKFEDWIPKYLQPDTRVAIRVEMEKARMSSDVPGYIYTFEIRDPKQPTRVLLKVGRAVNLVKRIGQWEKQCGSKEQVLRGWWPWTLEDGDDGASSIPSLMKGRVKTGIAGDWCHRLERLVHLELADLSTFSPYLEPGFPNNASTTTIPAAPSTPKKKALKAPPCADCGAIHKEIFSFTRVESGRYKDKEWDSIVRPIIHKWGEFVQAYV